MKKNPSTLRTSLMAAALMLAPLSVLAQQTPAAAPAATPAATPAPAAPASASSFDMGRVAMVTAGVIGGVLVANLVTSGVIVPFYHWSAGSAAVTGISGAAGEAATVATGVGAAAGRMHAMAGTGMWAIRSVMTTLGAIGGGFYADSLYQTK